MEWSNDKLMPVVEWMRAQGVVRLMLSEDAMDIQLGTAPPLAPTPSRAPTDEELVASAAKARKQQEALLFASSEGFPVDFEDE